ncbi:TIGR01440 family protein [Oceanobacillus sojae]|uniref:TIGR01440 family protein n=1 Tax=Oceanobacillus sojae TaxID=582851 RepID=UPI000988312D|nr:TIGR01440 family protein [Oceanobacillus sojae]MCT1901177.1 TIGR01440 family protein [Oceanobacillus sojae]
MIIKDLKLVIDEWLALDCLRKDEIVVIGCSTSEVAGQPIGTSGSTEIAKTIYEQMSKLQKQTGVHLAFQCCEHLNRSLVVERQTAVQYGLEEVAVVPVPKAGGSMASYAYQQMESPAVVENISAHAGIDIGETMIGMHLKPVAVPLKLKQRTIGHARVRAARTRPKLIGGHRAFYGENPSR